MRAIAGKVVVTVVRSVAECYHRVVSGPGRFRCGVCDRRVRSFVPLPRFYFRHLREAGWPYEVEAAETCNARQYSCPRCAASDRDRLLALAVAEFFTNRVAAATVVDFAPSEPLSRFIRRTIRPRDRGDRYRTADLFMRGVDDRVDITDMACYATGSVDLLLCSHVLEHVPDDRKAMREMHRILKPGGCGLMLVPIVRGVEATDEDPTVTDPKERWRRFGQDDHVRLYSKAGFVGRLDEAGFAVHQRGADHFGAARFGEQGIAAGSVLYVAVKPGVTEGERASASPPASA